MTASSNATPEARDLREPAVAVGPTAKRAALVAVGSSLANAGVWLVGHAVGRMTIGVGEVVVGSLIGAAGAFAVFAALSRFARRPRRVFLRIAIAILVLYALGPISAFFAPYREGAETFNLVTVVATEAMHLVSGLWVMAAFTRTPKHRGV